MCISVPEPYKAPIFPDISELDRAGGRVTLRKLFSNPPPEDDGTFITNFVPRTEQ